MRTRTTIIYTALALALLVGCATSQVQVAKKGTASIVLPLRAAQDAEVAAYHAAGQTVIKPAGHLAISVSFGKAFRALQDFERLIDQAPADKAALKASVDVLGTSLTQLFTDVTQFFPDGPTKDAILSTITATAALAVAELAAVL